MAKWATDNRIIYKAYQNWSTCQTFSDGKNEIEKKFSIKLKNWHLKSYPYIDSFKWLDMNNGLLTNYKPEHFKSVLNTDSNFRTLTTSSGGYESGNYLGFCELDREYGYSGDIVEVDGKNYNTRNLNYSDTLDRYILRSESTYSEELEDYVYSDFNRNDKDLMTQRLEYLAKIRAEKPNKKSESGKIFESFSYSPWIPLNETENV